MTKGYTVNELVDGEADLLRALFPPQTNKDGSQKTSKKKFTDATGKKFTKEVPLLVNRSALIRAIIRAEKEHCDTHGKPEKRTIRDFWYSHIKVPLMRAEGEAAKSDGWGREASLALSSVFSKMVLSRELRYIDLNIKDESREIAEIEWWKPHPFSKVVVYVEKEATFTKLKPVTDTYNIALITGKGYVATAALEGFILSLESRDEPLGDYTILLMADYDAYGFKIGNDLQERFSTLGLGCKVQRCAIYPNQVSRDVLLNKTFPVPLQNPYDKDWCKKYGITDSGKIGDQTDNKGTLVERGANGIELQALEGHELRAILIEHLKKYAPEAEMVQAVLAEQKRGTDDEALNAAAEKTLRDRDDVRFRIIDLCKEVRRMMEDSVEKDLRTIKKALHEDAREIVYGDEFDEFLEFDPAEMLQAALSVDDDFDPSVNRSGFVKNVTGKLVELAQEIETETVDALEPVHDKIVEARDESSEVLA
jgi:hypothetical protein